MAAFGGGTGGNFTWDFLVPTTKFDANDIPMLFNSIVSWVAMVATFIAVIYLIWNGIQYITAAGDEEKQGAAKRGITGSVIGIIVIILAYTIVHVVFNTLSKGAVNTGGNNTGGGGNNTGGGGGTGPTGGVGGPD